MSIKNLWHGIFGTGPTVNPQPQRSPQSGSTASVGNRHRFKGKVAGNKVTRSPKRSRVKAIDSTGQISVEGLNEIVSQVLDLAQRVHAVAGQAESAVLRAEAAVLKADTAVTKAETASSRADASFSKADSACSRAEVAVLKAEAASKRSELAANKAGLAAGKSELAAAGRESVEVTEEDNRTKKLNNPVSQIALMGMKLRSGMKNLDGKVMNDEDGSIDNDYYNSGEPVQEWAASFGREDVASGLVTVDGENTIPKVAPFIMQPVEKPTKGRLKSDRPVEVTKKADS